MLSDYLSSPLGVLMMPDASVLLLPGWAWTLITGRMVAVVAMFYLPLLLRPADVVRRGQIRLLFPPEP